MLDNHKLAYDGTVPSCKGRRRGVEHNTLSVVVCSGVFDVVKNGQRIGDHLNHFSNFAS